MQRNELWKALADASDTFAAAMLQWSSMDTPANRLRVEEGARDYMNCLSPVIGNEAAFQFESAFQKYLDSIDRRERLLATLAGQSTIDESRSR